MTSLLILYSLFHVEKIQENHAPVESLSVKKTGYDRQNENLTQTDYISVAAIAVYDLDTFM